MGQKSKLSKLPGYKNGYLFDESRNEFGTIKDRRNRTIIDEASRLHVDKLVLITSGNNGYSLARMAQGTGIKVVCVVSRHLDEKIKSILRNVAYQVLELNLEQKILRPEELITIARETDEEVIWDVTNGYEDAYLSLVREIAAEVRPDYIVCPVGSGGIFIGIVEGVRQFLPNTKVIGIGSREEQHSYADKLSTPWTPYARAMDNAVANGHYLYRLSEDQIKNIYKLYKGFAKVEPSSAIVFGVFGMRTFKPNETFVLINSGRLVS